MQGGFSVGPAGAEVQRWKESCVPKSLEESQDLSRNMGRELDHARPAGHVVMVGGFVSGKGSKRRISSKERHDQMC